jgi:hypothetical protein
LSASVNKLIKIGQLRGPYALAIHIASGPVALVTIISIYVLLLTGAFTIQIVLYVRLLHLIIGITLLVVATRTTRVFPIAFISAFLIIDQTRAILKSVSMYFNIDLF